MILLGNSIFLEKTHSVQKDGKTFLGPPGPIVVALSVRYFIGWVADLDSRFSNFRSLYSFLKWSKSQKISDQVVVVT